MALLMSQMVWAQAVVSDNNGSGISDNVTIPTSLATTNFSVPANENIGTTPFTIGRSPLVAISGTNALDFTVTTQPTSTVAVRNGTTTSQENFNPSVVGIRRATASIANGYSNKNSCTFAIQEASAKGCKMFKIYNLYSRSDASPGNEICANATGVCTLSEAIQEANASSCSPLMITLSVNGRITLDSNLPIITKSLSINGNGTFNTIISGNNPYCSLNSISMAGVSVTIQDLKATNGFMAGTAFVDAIDFDSNGGTLNVNNVMLIKGAASDGGEMNVGDGQLNLN